MLKRIISKIPSYIPLYREMLMMKNMLKSIQSDLVIAQSINAMQYYSFELQNNPRYKDPRMLPRYSFQVNSQNGEDGIIHEIFKRINVDTHIFVEVGVGDGTSNNTAFLLSQGWKGFWIDGNAAFLNTLSLRKDLQDECITSSVSFVDRNNIVDIFTRLGVPKSFDLLSLDVDQNTYYIWEALREFKPRAVVIEYNASIPADVDWKVNYDAQRVWDGTQNFGASLKAYEKLGSQLGYSLVGCDFSGSNAFFVLNELVTDKFAGPFTAEAHFEPPRYEQVRWRGYRPGTILDRKNIK